MDWAGLKKALVLPMPRAPEKGPECPLPALSFHLNGEQLVGVPQDEAG